MINIGNIVAAEMDRIIDSEEHIKMFSKVASNKEQSLDDLIISLSSISENLESIGLDKSAQNILSVINSIIKEAADPEDIESEKKHLIDEVNEMDPKRIKTLVNEMDPEHIKTLNELIDELGELNPPEIPEEEPGIKGLDLKQLQSYLGGIPDDASGEFEEDPIDLDSDISIGKEIKETSAKLDKFINKYSKEEKEDKKFNFNKKPEFNFNKKKDKTEKIDKKDKKDKKNSKPEFNFNKKKDKGDKEDKKSNKFLKKLEKKLKKT